MRTLLAISLLSIPVVSLAQETTPAEPSSEGPPQDAAAVTSTEEPVDATDNLLWWCDDGMAVAGDRCLRGFTMVEVAGGPITVGRADGVFSAFRADRRREERLSSSYWISTTEVTQGQFESLMGFNPSETCAARIHESLPVTCVSWNDAVAFANTLSEAAGRTAVYGLVQGQWERNSEADGFRLPSSLEWERAARGGRSTLFSGADNPKAVAWFRENARNSPETVAQRMPNDLGLYDMSGNVWEWVWDSYVQQVLPGKTSTADESGPLKLQRGGSYSDAAAWLTITSIDYDRAEYFGPTVGFRLVRNGTPVPAEPEVPSTEKPKKEKKKDKKES